MMVPKKADGVPPRYQSDLTDATSLAQPLEFVFSGRTASNRFMKAAMTEQLSTWDKETLSKRGIPTRNLCRVYERWGEGDIGVVVTGNVSKHTPKLAWPLTK
jgi:2,4-dienoyl-CoA reductase-like NADH-dependent reductase (Old Yellow Enzyme family)